jgi:hypothetical protein
VRELLGIPEQYGVLCILALGMKAEQRKAFDESKLQWEKLHLGQFKH